LEHSVDVLRQKLYDREYKMTPQRRVVLEVFANNPEEHLSAEDVFDKVRQSYPEIGLATVYRTLDLFAELDILQKMDFGDGRARYEFTGSQVHHHHHLVCLKCGSVTEFEDDLLEALEEVIKKKNDFEIVNHELKFYGYCSKCRGKSENPGD